MNPVPGTLFIGSRDAGVAREGSWTFSEMIGYMRDNDIPLAGAVYDFTCPRTGKNYMFFPVRKL